ncbi:hypothetical protein pb186bvf_013574 [Paramecium bursaria]
MKKEVFRQFIVIAELKIGQIKIIYNNDEKIQHEILQKYREEQNLDNLQLAKKMIETFIKQTKYFGTVNDTNYNETLFQFLLNSFQSNSDYQFQQIMLDDYFYISQCLDFKNKSDLISKLLFVFIIDRLDNQQQILNYCLLFVAKALTEIDNDVKDWAHQVYQNLQLFEQKLNDFTTLYSENLKSLRQKDIAQFLQEKITNVSQDLLKNSQLRITLNQVVNSIQSKQQIQIRQFKLHLPNYEIPRRKIKDHQTMLINQAIVKKHKEKKLNNRLIYFLENQNPTQSFWNFCIMHNFNMTEIETFVNHLINFDPYQIIIINELSKDSFYVNTLPKQVDKYEERLNEKFQVDLIYLQQIFDKPTSQNTLEVDPRAIKIKKEQHQRLMKELILYLKIRECQVYLYFLDPFITDDIIRKTIIQPQIDNNLGDCTQSWKETQRSLVIDKQT